MDEWSNWLEQAEGLGMRLTRESVSCGGVKVAAFFAIEDSAYALGVYLPDGLSGSVATSRRKTLFATLKTVLDIAARGPLSQHWRDVLGPSLVATA